MFRVGTLTEVQPAISAATWEAATFNISVARESDHVGGVSKSPTRARKKGTAHPLQSTKLTHDDESLNIPEQDICFSYIEIHREAVFRVLFNRQF